MSSPFANRPCPEGFSRCVECGECKSDPDEFYDGLRCTECCEAEEEAEAADDQ